MEEQRQCVDESEHMEEHDSSAVTSILTEQMRRSIKRLSCINRQTDRQTDRHRQTDRQTQRETDRQTQRETDRQTQRETDRQTQRQTDRHLHSTVSRSDTDHVKLCKVLLLLLRQLPGVGLDTDVGVESLEAGHS